MTKGINKVYKIIKSKIKIINSLNFEEGKVDKEERMNPTAICRNQEGMRGLEFDTKAEEKTYLEFGSEEKSNVELDPKNKRPAISKHNQL